MDTTKIFNLGHRCFYFSREVILFVKECEYPRVFSSIFNQVIRSATSIGANIVEGGSGSSRKDWKNFYVIALKSANETKYWLCLIKDIVRKDEEIEKLLKEVNELSKIIASIILKANK